MKKENKIVKLTSVVFLLTMICLCLVSGTYSKYTSSASGTDATVVGKWSFLVNGTEIATKEVATIDFGLFDTILDEDGGTEEDVAENKIAPGTSGAFEFKLKNNSDVTAQYQIDFEITNENNIPIEFSTDGTNWDDELSIEPSDDTVLAIGSGEKTQTVMWRWVFDGDNAEDTALGTMATAPTISVSATVTAKQYDGEIVKLSYKEEQLFPEVKSYLGDNLSSMKLAYLRNGSFSYSKLDYFAGKTITKIGIPVKTVVAIDENQTFTVKVFKNNTNAFKGSPERTYTLTLPEADLIGTNKNEVNKWIYVDCNIEVGDDETLAFSDASDKVNWGYIKDGNKPEYQFFINVGKDGAAENSYLSDNILFDIYYKKEVTTEENTLVGKKLSVFGDSISTFAGYNNDTNANSNIGDNKVFYSGSNGGITNVNQTWWMKTINETGMTLLVNNSSSGAKVKGVGNVSRNTSDQGIGIRTENLHDNVGENAGTNPDIIAIYMGTNDANAGFTVGTYSEDLYNSLITDKHDGSFTYADPTTFTEAYIVMVHKIINNYKDADVYCMTLLPNGQSNATKLEPYNTAIKNVANHYGLSIVDLYANSGITYDNIGTYLNSDNLHPVEAGMTAISNTFIDVLEKNYLN